MIRQKRPHGLIFGQPGVRAADRDPAHHVGVIAAAGVLLNYISLTLSRHLESILFSDMTGTALVAILLGPWWGAMHSRRRYRSG